MGTQQSMSRRAHVRFVMLHFDFVTDFDLTYQDDLNLIRELQMKIEQVQSDNVEKTVLLNSVNERVNVAEEARQRLHDLVMELEVFVSLSRKHLAVSNAQALTCLYYCGS